MNDIHAFSTKAVTKKARPNLGRLARRLGAIAVFSALSLNTAVAAPLDLAAFAERLPEQGEVHLLLFNGEQSDGAMRLGWRREGAALQLFDRTQMPSAEVFEAYQASLDATSLQAQSVSIQFYSGLNTMHIDYDRVRDPAVLKRQISHPTSGSRQSDIALEMAPGTLLRAMSFVLPLVDTSPVGETISYVWFAPMAANPLQEVSLHVKEGGLVDSPEGAIEALRYELRGASPENDIYVSKETPRRLLKIDVLGTALQFRLPTSP